ncbi:alpha-amylase family glycosyl hydrolase [Oceanobacillus luteolus]|uniref:Alpha-amylase family glycosyl hydrolase n=1 Tax=Oceanobacillus luteolus TaxID=1274358 RepID=A0ABW4HT29_9BACI|nr:alpha-amylase family glycosyl hydrolase [Oceanobacillus luteolus]MCM3741084.1 alpha-amylase family glycosyl hydrolase [Oceanobacillus luteolus]
MKKNMIMSIAVLFSLLIYGLPIEAADRQIEDEIIYKVMIDRYNNGDFSIDEGVDVDDPQAYHGGDIEGIKKRLNEKADLGVTTIALSPIMANSENGFHGYWVEDFTEMEEQFGTIEDLDELVAEAHKLGMKVVIEFVTNYVSRDHEIALEPEFADWILTDEVNGPDWTENVVQLNQDNPEVQKFLIDAASFWLKETNVDGLVLHAVDQSSVDFLSNITSELKNSYPDHYLIGDVLNPESDVSEIMENTELDAVDNYALSRGIAEVFSEVDQSPEEILELHKEYAEAGSILFVDDFYSERFTQKFSENGRNSVTTWTLALTYMYTTPGTPMIIQGSEVSMYGETAEDSQRLVPHHSGEPELKEFHDRISSLHDEFPALRHGDFELVDSRDSFAVFKRTYEDETLYVAINNGSESSYIDITDVDSDKMLRGYLGDNIARENEEGNHRIGIPRESVEVYEVVDYEGFNWLLISLVGGVMIVFVTGIIYLTLKQKRREASEQTK